MLVIYDTLTGKKREFRPRDGVKVMMYACGPTTYDHAHMGHAKTAIFFDFLRRYLEMKGYFVVYASNITDIDDKVIKRGQELGEEPVALARKYARDYFRDMDALRVRRPNITPYATDHIPEIIEFIEGLIERGYAYESDGDVYFSVEKFPEYGKLSKRKPEEMLAGHRVDIGKKRAPLDFALWKAAKEGEPAWPSPWGPGRPGWHIECSAMNYRYFGPTLDIHGGGTDLIFPHHENEIAQSEALTGKPFALYWVHTGMLNVNKEKMSKSLRNYFLVREALRDWRPEVLRVALLNAHYRTPLEYSPRLLEEAKRVHARIWSAWQSLPSEMEGVREGNRWVERLTQVLDDNLNTREAFSVALEAVSRETSPEVLRGFLEVFDALFTVIPEETRGESENALIELLVEVRDRARKKKDYEMADYIRDSLRELGILLEDTKDGTRWRRG